MAKRVSPPPARLNAFDDAIASARSLVPNEKGWRSNTPIGPFQIIFFAFRSLSAISRNLAEDHQPVNR